MTGTERLFQIKRAVLRALADCSGFAVREEVIREQTLLKIDFLQPTTAELDMVLNNVDADRLSVALPSERGRKLQITDAGRLWLAQNQ